jgi:hypothetical protein
MKRQEPKPQPVASLADAVRYLDPVRPAVDEASYAQFLKIMGNYSSPS